MSSVYTLLLALFIGLMFNVLTQMIVVRFTATILRSIMYGLLIGLIAYGIIFVNLTDNIEVWFSEDIFVGLFIYLTFSFCFWAFLNLNLTSVRIRMLRELYNQAEGLSPNLLVERYSPEELLLRRVERLQANGQVIAKNDRLVLQSKKLLIVYMIMLGLRRIILPARVRNQGVR